jgi:hypothetical protein
MSDLMNLVKRLNSVPVYLLLESENLVIKSLPENPSLIAKRKAGEEFPLAFNTDLAIEAIYQGGKEISEAEYLSY